MKGQACGGPLKTEVKELKGDLRPAPPYPSRVKTVDKGTQVTPEREAVSSQTHSPALSLQRHVSLSLALLPLFNLLQMFERKRISCWRSQLLADIWLNSAIFLCRLRSRTPRAANPKMNHLPCGSDRTWKRWTLTLSRGILLSGFRFTFRNLMSIFCSLKMRW